MLDLRAVYSAITSLWSCPSDVEQQAFLRAIRAIETAGFATASGDQGIKLGNRNVQRLETLKQEEMEMMDRTVEAIAPNPEPKPKVRHRRKTISVDPDLLRTVAAAFDIEIRGRGGAAGLSYEAALGQLLEHLAQGHSQPEPQTAPQPP